MAIMSSATIHTGQLFIFPSLWPSTFLFFYLPLTPENLPCKTILSHGTGILIGLLTENLIRASTPITRVVSAALALGLVAAAIIIADFAHLAAASTTLLVSLGLISESSELVFLMVAVVLLATQALVINQLSGIAYPFLRGQRENTNPEITALSLQTRTPVVDTYRTIGRSTHRAQEGYLAQMKTSSRPNNRAE